MPNKRRKRDFSLYVPHEMSNSFVPESGKKPVKPAGRSIASRESHATSLVNIQSLKSSVEVPKTKSSVITKLTMN